MGLDKIDAHLLDLVQRNNRLASEQLSAMVGLSASGVQRRLKRLRAEGVIERDVSIIRPMAVGRQVTALVLITFERGRLEIVDNFKQAMRKMTDVMSAFSVAGQADFVLLVTATDLESYEDFTKRLAGQHPNIKRLETMIVLDRIKVGFTLPIAFVASAAYSLGGS
ncbi:Lrp/AsnC family transcriptional regulator [Bradyrhizobium sp. CW1]|nr:Lrp/AsnC family transcriptional regulator [Bradyrhizobium sp. CW1]UPJ31491.1 Lrp/AsnC family transcriptional regulator [Bradyrhizobium sp. CW1]